MTFLIVGETPAARKVCATLEAQCSIVHLMAPTDAELARTLASPLTAAAILVREDVHALRYALAIAHLAPALQQVVTVFDRTMAGQLRSFLPQCTVFSPASIAAPSIAGPSLDPETLWVRAQDDHIRQIVSAAAGRFDVRRTPASPVSRRRRISRAVSWNRPRHHDTGTRLMFAGLFGLLAVLLIDWAWLALAGHHDIGSAFLDAARVVATVGPGPTGPSGVYGIWSGLAMLATIGFTAVFTAGLIDRLFEPRLLSMVGARAVPRRDHVIVVGMGQLGVRLCELLVNLGIPVVGLERSRSARWLPVARSLGVPVLIGDGTERSVLQRLHLDRCRSLAAVGSDDLDNISVAVAATAVSPGTRVVLRAGEQEAIAETRSLLPLGVIRDVTELAAAFVIAEFTGDAAAAVLTAPDGTYAHYESGAVQKIDVSSRDDCPHPLPAATGQRCSCGRAATATLHTRS
ncbi:potassium channel family protein [Jiangella muralis]|uniref:potassium channel family protein n=1 Tax=Jiangella muralis TaxID=702383 RepID=UPI00069F699C|nr:NAD(P)-binding protein [Jiangella muralis]